MVCKYDIEWVVPHMIIFSSIDALEIFISKSKKRMQADITMTGYLGYIFS